MANETKQKPTERMYQILVRPLVTEKSTLLAESGAIAFEVDGDATKPEIKTAVETLYKTKVERVNTLNQKGKVKRFRGVLGRRSDVKKAYIKLAEGHTIDVSTGV